MLRSVKTLLGGSKNQVLNLDGSQKLGVLYDKPKAE